MAEMLLTIQHNNTVFSPPVEDKVKIEWEQTGSPGKLTFTVIPSPTSAMDFFEGDVVCFYYDNKPIFMGYIFTKKRDRENHIEVTCYDQIRYLKNKYTYVFQNKTASEIIQALCRDLNLYTGTMDDTAYVIPSLVEENKTVLDIALGVIEDTLTNTGNLYTLYDDFGKLTLKNSANMVSNTLIMDATAENFDYSSSIDDETYNNITLYYKEDDNKISLYTAASPSKTGEWGTLRYFEEVKNKTIAQNKANSLLKLYNKKTRKLKITKAFGDTSVRGGTLIPVKLNLGDVIVNNYMLVTKVTHTFESDYYTMDLTLEGAWEDGYTGDMVSKTYDAGATKTSNSQNKSSQNTSPTLTVNLNTDNNAIALMITYTDTNGKFKVLNDVTSSTTVTCKKDTVTSVAIFSGSRLRGPTVTNLKAWVSSKSGNWSGFDAKMSTNASITIAPPSFGGGHGNKGGAGRK